MPSRLRGTLTPAASVRRLPGWIALRLPASPIAPFVVSGFEYDKCWMRTLLDEAAATPHRPLGKADSHQQAGCAGMLRNAVTTVTHVAARRLNFFAMR